MPAAAARFRPFFFNIKLVPINKLDDIARINPLVLSEIAILFLTSSAIIIQNPYKRDQDNDLFEFKIPKSKMRTNPISRQIESRKTKVEELTSDQPGSKLKLVIGYRFGTKQSRSLRGLEKE